MKLFFQSRKKIAAKALTETCCNESPNEKVLVFNDYQQLVLAKEQKDVRAYKNTLKTTRISNHRADYKPSSTYTVKLLGEGEKKLIVKFFFYKSPNF